MAKGVSMKTKHRVWNEMTTPELEKLLYLVIAKNASFPQRKAKRMIGHLNKIMSLRERVERLINPPAEFSGTTTGRMSSSAPSIQYMPGPRRSAQFTPNQISTRKITCP